jgi:hypothetical protein
MKEVNNKYYSKYCKLILNSLVKAGFNCTLNYTNGKLLVEIKFESLNMDEYAIEENCGTQYIIIKKDITGK